MADPLSTVLSVASLNLSTAAGVRDLLAATMRQLTHLPLDVRVATAIGQLATSQRSLLETSDLEARLAALEAAQSDRPHLRAS